MPASGPLRKYICDQCQERRAVIVVVDSGHRERQLCQRCQEWLDRQRFPMTVMEFAGEPGRRIRT